MVAQVKDGQVLLTCGDHNNSMQALLSFVVSQNIDGIHLIIDEADRTKFDKWLAMLLLPMSAERAAEFVRSHDCIKLFRDPTVHRPPPFDWSKVEAELDDGTTKFLAPGSRVHSVCNMSATHLADNLPLLLKKFPSMLGFQVSKEELDRRGYQFEHTLDRRCGGLSPTDFAGNPMQDSELVKAWVREICENPRGTLAYVNWTCLHQGFTNLNRQKGQMTAAERAAYLRAADAAPGTLPPVPPSLQALLAAGYTPKYNHNTGAARVLARDLLPQDVAADLTPEQLELRTLHFGGCMDVSITAVLSQEQNGSHAGDLIHWTVPTKMRELESHLTAERPWLGIFDEGFVRAATTDISQFIKLCVEAGFAYKWLFGAHFRNLSLVAHCMYKNCVLDALGCFPKQGAMLNEVTQLFSRLAGVGIADMRFKSVGRRECNVLIRPADFEQIQVADKLVDKLFDHLSTDVPVPCADLHAHMLGNVMYSERFRALGGPGARSIGTQGDREIIQPLMKKIGTKAQAVAKGIVDFVELKHGPGALFARNGQPLVAPPLKDCMVCKRPFSPEGDGEWCGICDELVAKSYGDPQFLAPLQITGNCVPGDIGEWIVRIRALWAARGELSGEGAYTGDFDLPAILAALTVELKAKDDPSARLPSAHCCCPCCARCSVKPKLRALAGVVVYEFELPPADAAAIQAHFAATRQPLTEDLEAKVLDALRGRYPDVAVSDNPRFTLDNRRAKELARTARSAKGNHACDFVLSDESATAFLVLTVRAGAVQADHGPLVEDAGVHRATCMLPGGSGVF